jgi:hypothetical protein
MKWIVDEKSHYTLGNFISRFDLVCADKLKISAFGIFFFIGMLLGFISIPSRIDKYGRRWYFLTGVVANIFTYLPLLLVDEGGGY